MKRVLVLASIGLAGVGCYFAAYALAERIDCQSGRLCLGTSDDDRIDGGDGGDFVFALGGGDDVDGHDGGDTVEAGSGRDHVSGHGGADELYGRDGGDFLHGNAADDSLNGNEEADEVSGGGGDDSIHGGDAWRDEVNGIDGTLTDLLVDGDDGDEDICYVDTNDAMTRTDPIGEGCDLVVVEASGS